MAFWSPGRFMNTLFNDIDRNEGSALLEASFCPPTPRFGASGGMLLLMSDRQLARPTEFKHSDDSDCCVPKQTEEPRITINACFKRSLKNILYTRGNRSSMKVASPFSYAIKLLLLSGRSKQATKHLMGRAAAKKCR
jgi:hypothetical protein